MRSPEKTVLPMPWMPGLMSLRGKKAVWACRQAAKANTAGTARRDTVTILPFFDTAQNGSPRAASNPANSSLYGGAGYAPLCATLIRRKTGRPAPLPIQRIPPCMAARDTRPFALLWRGAKRVAPRRFQSSEFLPVWRRGIRAPLRYFHTAQNGSPRAASNLANSSLYGGAGYAPLCATLIRRKKVV